MSSLLARAQADIDIAKLLPSSEGRYCMEYKYRDKKETCHEKI